MGLSPEREKERGQWAVCFTSPQSYIITFLIRWLKNVGDFREHLLVESLS